MRRTRVIPVLLIMNGGVYKTTKFSNPVYIGDPINSVRLFNDLEVDEIIILDIQASKDKKAPNIEFVTDIVSEAFMPVAYGGGIQSMADASRVLRAGVEKVVLNDCILNDIDVVSNCIGEFGSQSVVAAVDVKKKMLGGYKVYRHVLGKTEDLAPVNYVIQLAQYGVGEIFVNAVDRDGMMNGYDLGIIESIASVIDIPLVVCGGAGSLDHMRQAVEKGACALAAGSMFVYKGKQKGVLISYPDEENLRLYLK